MYRDVAARPRTDWANVSWFSTAHVLMLTTLVYAISTHMQVWQTYDWSLGFEALHNYLSTRTPFAWQSYVMAVVLFYLCQLAISAGVHQHYAHPAYNGHPVVQYVFLSLFSAVFQGPAAWWALVHLQHHDYTDEPLDPHSPVQGGFFHAHVGWLLLEGIPKPPRAKRQSYARILEKFPLLKWQQRYYRPLGIGIGFVLPTTLGTLWGDPLGGLLLGGFVRIVFQYHFTWCVNSVNHLYGTRPYPGSSATNNRLLAIPTVGEGYHANHHRHPNALIGGLSKYCILLLGRLGLATDIRLMPA